jgi:hypothetical protein
VNPQQRGPSPRRRYRHIGHQPLDQAAALVERQAGDQALGLLKQRCRLLGGRLRRLPSVRAYTLGTQAFFVEAKATARAAEALNGAAGAGAWLERVAALLTSARRLGVD